jgi:hypothetical protein
MSAEFFSAMLSRMMKSTSTPTSFKNAFSFAMTSGE